MKREILFRAKRVGDGEWVEGYVSKPGFTDVEGNIESYFFNSVDKLGWISEYEVSAETVCEYTGMPDKNGRKIFEGDILHFVNHINDHEWLCTIAFSEGSFVCRYNEGDVELGGYNHFNAWHEKVDWEVVGNIFDNPGLLGGD